MKRAYHGQELGTLLIAEGLCPPNARLIELLVPADGAVFIRYEVFMHGDDLLKIARALRALSERSEPGLEVSDAQPT